MKKISENKTLIKPTPSPELSWQQKTDSRLDKLEYRTDKVEQRLDKIEQRLDRVEERLSAIELQLFKIKAEIVEMQNSLAYLPKLYDRVDKFMAEIMAAGEARVFMNNQLLNQDKRITKLETARA